MGKLLSATTIPGQTAVIISSFETRTPWPWDERQRDPSAPRSDGHRDKNTLFIRVKQTAASSVETKPFEQENLASGACIHALPPQARKKAFFITIKKF